MEDGREIVVLFDLDGTLTDPYIGISRSFDHALVRLGIPRPKEIDYRTLIGPPIRRAFDILLGPDSETNHERAVAFYREHFSEIGLFENTPYDGVHAMLERLSADFTLYVCTSKPTVYATRILEKFAFARYFREIYGCELDGTRGNKAELLAWMLERESFDASRAVLIGDRMHDVTAAIANGARGAGVLWGYGSESELESAGAIRLFSSPGDISPEAIRDVFRVHRA